jgi:hypothetical protein
MSWSAKGYLHEAFILCYRAPLPPPETAIITTAPWRINRVGVTRELLIITGRDALVRINGVDV